MACTGATEMDVNKPDDTCSRFIRFQGGKWLQDINILPRTFPYR